MTEISEERQNIEVLATYIKEMGVGGLDAGADAIFKRVDSDAGDKLFAQAIIEIANFLPCSQNLSEYSLYQKAVSFLEKSLNSNWDDMYKLESIL